MKPTLLILAAGMASRYGSMKQTEGFGPNGETIMDYSIYSAINAGFGKVVFIVREDFADAFKQNIEPKLKDKIEVDYVFQDLKTFVDENDIPDGRTKPWGTGHAMLCAKNAVLEPFAVINADDFYGNDAFIKAADFLKNKCTQKEAAIIGYNLGNTLSEHGNVSRGVCQISTDNFLTSIKERTKIYTTNGSIVFEENGKINLLTGKETVSMNFWCFHPSIFNLTDILFKHFPKNNMDNLKAEFFIPTIAEHFINEFKGSIKAITTTSQWFGVTYKEDAPSVSKSLNALIENGEYPSSLWL
ncbi:MAG: sugar phosphate nucleotidyltransferase [Ferruginibacter sp.]|nr:nucleotidyltransferase [Ferruginibacter sp.]